jgi:hypothetical protein
MKKTTYIRFDALWISLFIVIFIVGIFVFINLNLIYNHNKAVDSLVNINKKIISKHVKETNELLYINMKLAEIKANQNKNFKYKHKKETDKLLYIDIALAEIKANQNKNFKYKHKKDVDNIPSKNQYTIFICEKPYKLQNEILYTKENSLWEKSHLVKLENHDKFLLKRKYYNFNPNCVVDVKLYNNGDSVSLVSKVNTYEVVVRGCKEKFNLQKNEVLNKKSCHKFLLYD